MALSDRLGRTQVALQPQERKNLAEPAPNSIQTLVPALFYAHQGLQL
jgi:hypothetical protein